MYMFDVMVIVYYFFFEISWGVVTNWPPFPVSMRVLNAPDHVVLMAVYILILSNVTYARIAFLSKNAAAKPAAIKLCKET